MSLFKIALRSLRQRALSTTLTGFSLALGVALVVSVLVIHNAVNESFDRTAEGYDLIVGAKGGSLQLVLNTVFHLSRPIENIPWSFYNEFVEEGGDYQQMVDVAIPFCLGDSYKGHRVVGTTPQIFETLEYGQGEKYEFAQGRNFDEHEPWEAVVGSLAARKAGLKIGSRFEPTHGVTTAEGVGHVHEEQFEIVGILEPTGTPNDRVIFVNIEGFYLMEGHAKEVEEEATEEEGHSHDGSVPHHHPGDEQPHTHDDDQKQDDKKDSDKQGDDEAPANAKPKAATSPEASPTDAGPADAEAPNQNPDAGKAGPDGEKQAAEAGADDHAHEEGEEHAHDHEAGHGHDEHAHDHEDGHHHHFTPLPESQREVTAILVRCSDTAISRYIKNDINEGQVAQAVWPALEVHRLLTGIVGNLQVLLLALAGLVVLVAGIGIMVAMYNSMNDRKHEIAVMRALGAGRGTVMTIILLESLFLALGGGIAGIVLGHGLLGAVSPMIVEYTGVSIGFFDFDLQRERFLIPVLIGLAVLAGLLPALTAYRTDVSKALAATP